MKVLIVTSEIGFDGGGMSFSCIRLKELLEKEHDVFVLCSATFPIVTAQGGANKDLESAIKKEYKLKTDIDKYADVDVVVGFGGGYNGYYASILAMRLNKRFVLSLRGSDINIAKWSAEDSWYLYEACNRADRIVCLSNEMTRNVLELCPFANGKIDVVQNSNGIFGKRVIFPNLPMSLKIGCAAAHLNEKKGVANLLYMVSEFKRISNIPIELELIGDIDGDLKLCYGHIIEMLDISDNVKFTRKVSRNELFEIMATWDFYVQASVCEGHPNAMIECLQNGTGFISTRTGFIAELIADKYEELLFDGWNPQNMACKLNALVGTPNLDLLFENVKQKIAETCDKDIVLQKWHELLSNDKRETKDMDVEHVHCVVLHDVQGELHDSITTPVSVFADFVSGIYKKGFALCSMKHYVECSKEDRRNLIVCTFDDGYSSLVSVVEPILRRFNFSATVFICTELVGKDNRWNNKDAIWRKHLSEEQLKTLASAGWEIASHGATHRNLLKLSDEEINYELSASKKYLDDFVGYSITYAYPYGGNNAFIQHCVDKYYRYAFAVSQGGSSLVIDRLQLRRYSIGEIYKMLR